MTYTCRSCSQETDNDSDVCDDCEERKEAVKEETPVCERCNGRGVIETGTLSKGPGGYGFDTVPCGCEERQAYRDAAEDAGWLIELVEFDRDEGPLPTALALPGSFTLGPPIRREQVPAGAVYEHSRLPGKLWLNDEPYLMTPDDFPGGTTTFRVATPQIGPSE